MADPEVVELKAGDFIWFMRPGEERPRPGRLISDGIYETVRQANGQLKQYAHIEYGTMDPGHELLGNKSAAGTSQRQTHETTAHWDPHGTPGTWHLPLEATHLEHPETQGA